MQTKTCRGLMVFGLVLLSTGSLAGCAGNPTGCRERRSRLR